jgi:hypothetical protein
MNIEDGQTTTAGYELVDDDRGLFDAFTEADFEDWLRVGLEGYLLEDQGAWAFPGAEGSIAQQDYLVLGLREAYHREWPAATRSRFRHAVAKVLASLEPSARYVSLFEHLLSLAAALAAPEVLRVLPARVGNGFFGQADSRSEDELFGIENRRLGPNPPFIGFVRYRASCPRADQARERTPAYSPLPPPDLTPERVPR